MLSSITLTSKAYSLLLLHAAAHPHSTVTGLLLAKTNDGQDKDREDLLVESVVPLAHHWTNLGTVEDIALDLLTSHLASTSSELSIVGLYEAHAKNSAMVLSHSALRLANKVSSQRTIEGSTKGKGKEGGIGTGNGSKASLALLLQNEAVLQPNGHALQPFLVPSLSSAQTFDQNKLTVQGGEETIKALTEAIRSKGAWKHVRDLDDHLEDTSADWIDNSLVASHLVVAKA